MSCTSELSALIRRSSPATVERFLHILYILDSRLVDAGDALAPGSLSLPSVCLILRYSLFPEPPRFLFALSGPGSLFRSPDCGLSWRMIYPSAGAAPVPMKAVAMEETDGGLSDIMQLLPRETEESDEDQEGEEDEVKLPTKARNAAAGPVASCLSGSGDVIVMGGKCRFLAVSGDKGIHFTPAPTRLWDLFGGSADVDHTAVVDSETVLVAAGGKLATVRIRVTAAGAVTFGAARVVLTCKGRICLLSAMRAAGSAHHVFAAESGVLHYSWNCGEEFIAIPHKLGFLRSIAAYSGARRSQSPAFPSACRVVQTLLGGPDAVVPPGGKAAPSDASYEYAFGLRRPLDATAAPLQGLAESLRDTFLWAKGGGGVYYQGFLATGTGAEVLPYDFSCHICIGVQLADDSAALFSHAANVSYTPYVRSAPKEAVPCAVSPAPGPGQVVLVRGSYCGVSLSRNGGTTWSTPHTSSPIALFPVDGGRVIVCGQRGTVTTLDTASGSAVSSLPIAGSCFRAPANIVAAVCL